jgi:serine/threonine protein kinase
VRVTAVQDLFDVLEAALADRYQIEREIGSGGMATVFLAQDLKHGRQVAVKALRCELAAAIGPQRFLNEIRITANLHHPHIVPLFDSGVADGFPYYVMPFVEGESLRRKLDREGCLPIGEALEIAVTIAKALAYAHEQNVVHRDIKPENILLHRGEVLVADFGIALALHAARSSRLTPMGFSPGTPHYMSPEQVGGKADVDGRSDAYSLGCVLYEMIAGEPPFSGHSVRTILTRHVHERPPSLRVVRPSVPGRIERAVRKALAKLPVDRFASVRQFAEALAR